MGKTWNYIKTWFGKKTEEVKDPEIEIEQAIQEAQKRDQELRNQAAQVIAHRTNVAAELEEASGDVAEAKELAKQALLRADAAAKAGNAADAEKWNTTALADRHEAAGVAEHRRHAARSSCRRPTCRPRRPRRRSRTTPCRCRSWPASGWSCSASCEAAKMQESVNKAMDQMTATVGQDAPSMEEVENKIQARMSQAAAKAELTEATSPEAAMAELKVDHPRGPGQLHARRPAGRAGHRSPPPSCRPPPPPPAIAGQLAHRLPRGYRPRPAERAAHTCRLASPPPAAADFGLGHGWGPASSAAPWSGVALADVGRVLVVEGHHNVVQVHHGERTDRAVLVDRLDHRLVAVDLLDQPVDGRTADEFEAGSRPARHPRSRASSAWCSRRQSAPTPPSGDPVIETSGDRSMCCLGRLEGLIEAQGGEHTEDPARPLSDVLVGERDHGRAEQL